MKQHKGLGWAAARKRWWRSAAGSRHGAHLVPGRVQAGGTPWGGGHGVPDRRVREEQGGGKLGARGRGTEGEAGKQRPGGTPANLAAGTVAVTQGELGQAGRLAVALVIPATAAARAGRGRRCGAARATRQQRDTGRR